MLLQSRSRFGTDTPPGSIPAEHGNRSVDGQFGANDAATVLSLDKNQAAAGDEETMEHISGELQTWLSGVEQSASQIGKRAGIRGVHLIGFSAALESRDVQTLSPRLNEIWAGTVEVKNSGDPMAMRRGRVIRAVGEIMRNSAANAPHAVARYGGGEFAILPPQTALNRCAHLPRQRSVV